MREETHAVSFVSGCCMLFPRWALDSLGLFIQDFFCYSEDNEWSWRATSAGAHLFYVPSAKLWHQVSASAGKNDQAGVSASIPASSWYFMIRNHLWTLRLWARPPIRKYLALSASVAIELRMIASHLAKAEHSQASAIFRGMCDGIWKPVPKWSSDR